MKLHFYKYHGTGNDFILIDNRTAFFEINNQKLIANLCDRHFGIGADGLILLENSKDYDFNMRYYNSDGNESSMCGNGGRCVVAFAKKLGVIENKTTFTAIDGLHAATISGVLVALQMKNIEEITIFESHTFLDTGSPHHVTLVDDVAEYEVVNNGRKVRNGAPYFEKGTNVNFVEQINTNTFKVRTYERGVEDETLSCGTGVTAVAIAMYENSKTKEENIKLETQGGLLEVSFTKEENHYTNVFLKGPTKLVFEGDIYVND